MKKIVRGLLASLFLAGMLCLTFAPAKAYAAEDAAETVMVDPEATIISSKAWAACIAIGAAAVAGAIGMAIAISKSNESIAKQPEAEGSIRTSMMLGLVFIETAIIYALIVAILVIFVL